MPAPADGRWAFACPACRTGLTADETGAMVCPACTVTYDLRDGILRLLTATDAARTSGFLAGYQRVRAAEGWGSDDPAWLRALPEVPASDPHAAIWRVRAVSLRVLRARVVADLPRGARVLDLGAGCCWLSAHLARMGHSPMAVDLDDDPRDGLGAGRHLGTDGVPPEWPRVQATFDRLPLPDGAVDAVVFNASLHYAADVATALREASRVLRPGGRIVVMDTPIYRDASSGAAMVAERAADLERRFGIAPGMADPVGYLTWAGLDALAGLGVRWTVNRPWYGVRWAMRPWRARLRRTREPATFATLVGRPDPS